MNPWGDCNLVFRVSMGNKATSTLVPASPPQINAVKKLTFVGLSLDVVEEPLIFGSSEDEDILV